MKYKKFMIRNVAQQFNVTVLKVSGKSQRANLFNELISCSSSAQPIFFKNSGSALNINLKEFRDIFPT